MLIFTYSLWFGLTFALRKKNKQKTSGCLQPGSTSTAMQCDIFQQATLLTIKYVQAHIPGKYICKVNITFLFTVYCRGG